MLIPAFLKAYETQAKGFYGATGAFSGIAPTGKILVVVQLSGGNDGLNTVVPYRNDIYYRERPGIAIKPDKVLTINDEVGLNPALAPLRALYDDGLLTVINNVGYPNPDRSHFRSMDIWQTASNSDQYLQTGWVGRYLDAACEGKPGAVNRPKAIEVGDGNTGTFSQFGDYNVIKGLSGDFAIQQGNNNTLTVSQNSGGSAPYVANIASVSQIGNGNMGTITQSRD